MPTCVDGRSAMHANWPNAHTIGCYSRPLHFACEYASEIGNKCNAPVSDNEIIGLFMAPSWCAWGGAENADLQGMRRVSVVRYSEH